ncbi:tetratricopeptide repeat protein [Streptomyces sp. NPDC001530]|uniref:tetratricopeptide repeat protein n=1 Tax=Streptomyces sp. NPDC001530 TaxID=3364582 RepID=UPI00367FA5A7
MSAARERPPWLVSIRRSRDAAPDGAGMLCTPQHVLTCAHVAAGKGVTRIPEGRVFVQFQYAEHTEPLAARVVPAGWYPATDDNRGDVAVLELEDPLPPDAEPAPLRTTAPGTWGHRFRAYGYPKGHARGGVPVRGEIVGPAEREWIQVEANAQAGWAVEGGFSGSPVWDVDADGVVGMLVTRDSVDKTDRRTAYAINVEALAHYWPDLAEHVRDTTTEELRGRLESLLAISLTEDGEIPRVSAVDPLDIGVSPSKYSESPETAQYVKRQQDDALAKALIESPSRFVLLVGRSKAGKSRTMFELLRQKMPTARLIVPRPDRSAPGELSRLPLPVGHDPAVIWLDDLHHFLQPGGLDLKVLDRFKQRERPVTVVATLSSKQRAALTALENEGGRVARIVLSRAKRINLHHLLNPAERALAELYYPGEDFSERGIGEQMVAAPMLEERLGDGIESCPPGWAVTKAAADWRRMGLEGPVPTEALQALFLAYMSVHHPSADAGDAEFRAGVEWARMPVAGTISLLQQIRRKDADPAYQVFAYVPEYLDARAATDPTAGVPDFAWEHATGLATPSGLLSVAYAALVREEPVIAERVLVRIRTQPKAIEGAQESTEELGVEPDGRAWAALMHGQLLLYRNEFQQAAALLEEAASSGVESVAPLARVELAGALMLMADRARARTLLEESIACSDLQVARMAQVGLAGLLVNEGDHERAQLLLQAVLASGDDEVAPMAKAYMGRMMTDEGDLAAVRRPGKASPQSAKPEQPHTSAHGTPVVLPAEQPWSVSRAVGQSVSGQMISALAEANLGGLFINQGKLDQAEAMLRSVIDSGQYHAIALAQAGLGEVLILKDRLDEAREHLEAVLRSGHPLVMPVARVTLGVLLLQQSETESGTELLRSVADADHPDQTPRAAHALGAWYASLGEAEVAEEWFDRALADGHPDWSGAARIGLAALAFDRDDVDGAHRLLQSVIDSGHRENGPRAADSLGDMLGGLGRREEAEAAYRIAIDSGHTQWSLIATIDLALLLSGADRMEQARELLDGVARSDHPEHAPRAADLLGDLLARLRRLREAEAAYRIAIDSGHAQWSLIASLDLAVMLADEGEFRRAEALLRGVARSDHETAAALAQALLGLVLIYSDGRTEGMDLLRTAAAKDFPNVRQLARFYLAKCLADDGDEEQAADLLQSVISDEPSDVTGVARAYLGVMRLRQGDEDAAEELLAGAEASEDPEAMAVAYLGTGEYLLDMGEIQSARELFEWTLETGVEETAPRARAFLGVERRASDDLDKARELLEAALADGDPLLEPMVRRYLGSTLVKQTQYAEAERVLTPLAGSDDTGHRPEALLLLARIAATQRRLEQAYRWFELAIAAGDPETEEQARYDYGQLLRREGQVIRAQKVLAPLAEDIEEPASIESSNTALELSPAPPKTPSGPSVRPQPVFTPLSSTVIALLGDVAAAEGQRQEARYWYKLALHSDDQSVQASATAGLARLGPQTTPAPDETA